MIIILIQYAAPKPVNWAHSFSKRDKIPFGCQVTYDYLEDIFPNSKIINAEFPVYNVLSDKKASNYIFINDDFSPDDLDSEELMKFIEKGNTAFIAANHFRGNFSDTLDLRTRYYYYYPSGNDSVPENLMNQNSSDSTVIYFTNEKLKTDSGYNYGKGLSKYYFSRFDSANSIVLGTDMNNNVNFIKMKYGKGELYLSSLPRAFSNYNLVVKDKAEYAWKALSYLPDEDLIWDEYYKTGRRYIRTPLRYILSEPALKTAYFLLIATLLLHVFFNTKRRQRIIPVIKPLKNTTLQFVDVVGSLYYQSKNHHNIGRKKVKYFLEFIRSNYLLPTKELNEELENKLSERSGVEKKEISELFKLIKKIEYKTSEAELLELSRLIHIFHQKRKR